MILIPALQHQLQTTENVADFQEIYCPICHQKLNCGVSVKMI